MFNGNVKPFMIFSIDRLNYTRIIEAEIFGMTHLSPL